MSVIRFLTTQEVTEIQSRTLPNSGRPDLAKLEGALSRIQTLIDYEESSDIFDFAAMYLIAISKAHAFNDANKRTAFQATSVFLLLNGVTLNTTLELVKLTLFAAIGEGTLEQVSFALKILSSYRDELLDETVSGY